MKKIFFYMMAVAVVLTTACNKENDVPNQMTMTTKANHVDLYTAGSGTMTIDWGDGTGVKTYSLSGFETEWKGSHHHAHGYSSTSVRTIRITGDNITHLNCSDNGLSSLDVRNYD